MPKTKTIFDKRYDRFIADLVDIRHDKGMSQRDLVAKSGYSTCFVGRTETRDRRLDFIEVLDYMRFLGLTKKEIKIKLSEWADLFVE